MARPPSMRTAAHVALMGEPSAAVSGSASPLQGCTVKAIAEPLAAAAERRRRPPTVKPPAVEEEVEVLLEDGLMALLPFGWPCMGL